MSSASFRARCLFQVCVYTRAFLFVCVFWPAASFRASTKARTKRLRKQRTNSASFFASFFCESFAEISAKFFFPREACEKALLKFHEGARKLAGFRLTEAAAG